MEQPCYLCKVEDPNEVHYDPDQHRICTICSVKLWELAQPGFVFDMRDQTISLTSSPASIERTVQLSTGYQVVLGDEKGLEHLFNACVGEVSGRLKGTDELEEKGAELISDGCICELHYIAGQLCQTESAMDIGLLLEGFAVHWERLAERLRPR